MIGCGSACRSSRLALARQRILARFPAPRRRRRFPPKSRDCRPAQLSKEAPTRHPQSGGDFMGSDADEWPEPRRGFGRERPVWPEPF